MSKFRELTLEQSAATSNLLARISNPALQRLNSCNDVGDSLATSTSFVNMVTNAPWKTTLTHLRIHGFHVNGLRPYSTFRAVLPETPALVDLQLTFQHMSQIFGGWSSGDDILDLLCIQEDETVVCPRPERLDLRYILFKAETLPRVSLLSTHAVIGSISPEYAPCLERFTICFPYKCLAGEKHAWSEDQRDGLEDLVDYLQEYKIVVLHQDEDEEDLAIGNVVLEDCEHSSWFY